MSRLGTIGLGIKPDLALMTEDSVGVEEEM